MYVRTFRVWSAFLTACLAVACVDVDLVDVAEAEESDTDTPPRVDLIVPVADPTTPWHPDATDPAPIGDSTFDPVWGDGEPLPEDSVPELLDDLVVAEVPADLPDYHRSDWRHWTDEDSDCQNTRAEILIRESTKIVTFTAAESCTVATGEWYGPFTGDTFYNAGELDIDHMVPLKNAHLSGAHAWTADERRAFANDMDHYEHLVAVKSSVNSSKGARGPEAWRPPADEYWCEYATNWVLIKLRWQLSVTADEFVALAEMLETC